MSQAKAVPASTEPLNRLKTVFAVASTLCPEDKAVVMPLLDALQSGRFGFEEEPWHNTDFQNAHDDGVSPVVYPSEMLIRAYDGQGRGVDHAPAMEILYKTGVGAALDEVIVNAALREASRKETFPVSINISADAALSPAFWARMEPVLDRHNPSDIVFEILEHAIPEGRDPAVLKPLKDKGFRFALDDVEQNAQGAARIDYFRDYADFVKIDGRTVRGGLLADGGMEHLITKIRESIPHASIIAEWVENFSEAVLLHKSFEVAAVQGRVLPRERMGIHMNRRTPTSVPA